MARIKLIIGVLAVVLGSLVALSGPAIAQGLNCQDAQGNWISCDGTYYAPVDNSWWGNGWDGNQWNPWWGFDDNSGVSQWIWNDSESGDVDLSFGVS